MRGVGVAVVPLLALLLLADGVHSALHDHYLHTPCNFLAFVAFNGPDFLQCIPQGTLMAQVQLYDVAFAYMRAHTHIYHGTTDGSWVSDQIYDDSFYSLTPNYAKLHGMTHSYFPTKISPSAYAKVGTAYTQPKIAVYDITNANSGTPDYLLLEPLRIEKLVKQIGEAGTDAWHKVWADEYDEQKDKDTGSGVNKKKVPPNVAAMRTMATKWNTQVPHIPLKGLIQHRFLPQVDLTVIMGGWMGRKSNRDALPTAQGNIDVATVKAYLHAQANFKNLEDFCGIADESRDIDTFLYDEMIVFGKPFAHVRDDVLDDPSTGGKEDAIMTHIQAWAAQCGQLAFTDPPYSIDYRTWIPRGSDLDKPLNTDVFSNGLTLAQLRTEVDGVVNSLDGHIPAGPGRDAFPKFKTLLTASSTGLLTGAQLSELRVHAYLILRAFCDDEDAWKAVQPDHHNNANNAMKNRICKRAYLSLNDPVVPLSHHHFFHSAGLNDNAADKQGLHKCKWSWSQRKCLPEGQCARQYHFGDFKMDKSCRVKP